MVSTIGPGRVASRHRRLLAGAALISTVATGCSISGHTSSPTTSAPVPSTPASATSTTAPGPKASGPRTVLSPVGLNVRRAPSTSAPVLGTAAQGVVLTVVGYTSSGGGWFKVKGATVTGWISAQPTLSAPGQFQPYSSSQFSALYPATWTESAMAGSTPVPTTSAPSHATSTTATPAAPSIVVFRPASGAGDIVVTAAGSVSELPHGRAGYSFEGVSQVLACDITAGLVVLQQNDTSPTTSSATSVPESLTYLAEVRFAVDKQHALDLYSDMSNLGLPFQIFKEFVASVTFNAPQCTG